MSEKHMSIVREHLAAFSARDWNQYKKNLVPGCIYVEPATDTRAEGLDKAVQQIQTWTVAFPDLKGTVKNLLTQENMVMAEIHWEGTHNGTLKGPFGEIPPTGKKGVLESVELFRFEGDKISEMRHYFDMMTILRQVGVQPLTPVHV